MLQLHLQNCGLAIGIGAGKDIQQTLEQARHSISILSPYVSSEFLDLLLAKQAQGVRVQLVTSSDCVKAKERTESMKKVIRQEVQIDYPKEKERKDSLNAANLTGWAVWLGLVLGWWFSVSGWWLLAIVFLPLHYKKQALAKVITRGYRYSTTLPVQIIASPYTQPYPFDKSKTLVHTKLFIVDDSVAFLGSINFTQAAFYYNYEARLTLTDPDSIVALQGEFDSLFSHGGGMPCTDIREEGRLVYGEKLNGLDVAVAPRNSGWKPPASKYRYKKQYRR